MEPNQEAFRKWEVVAAGISEDFNIICPHGFSSSMAEQSDKDETFVHFRPHY